MKGLASRRPAAAPGPSLGARLVAFALLWAAWAPARLAPAAAEADGAPRLLEDVTDLLLDVPPTTVVRVAPTRDETVAQITLSRAPGDLDKQLLAWKTVHWLALPAPTGTEAAIFVAMPHPIVEMRQERVKGGVKVAVQTAHTVVTLRQRVARPIPTLDVAGDDARDLAAAELHLASGNTQAARRALTLLLPRYPIQPWVQLRLGDVAFLAEGPPAACGLYEEVASRFGDRIAGVVAALRMFALECPQEHSALVWTTLLKRTNADDPTGRWLGEEARWALEGTQQVPQMLAALGWGERTLGRRLWRRLVARVVHVATPLKVATASFQLADALAQHPDAEDLRLWVASAFCRLELPERARKIIPEAQAKASLWAESARACATVAPMWPRRQSPQEAALTAKIADLDARLAAATRATAILAPPGQGEAL